MMDCTFIWKTQFSAECSAFFASVAFVEREVLFYVSGSG